MDKFFLEYIWLDGYRPQNLRSKIKILSLEDSFPNPEDLPIWNYDGSSTMQAPGHESECILKPVRVYNDGTQKLYVLCEVLNSDGTPHATNKRAYLNILSEKYKRKAYWWGYEQEYFITKDKRPLGWPDAEEPDPQGRYYCGVGGNQVVGRSIVEEHAKWCLEMGIDLTGINAEVALGQWEYQCFGKDTLKVCDDLWMSRYLLQQLAEFNGLDIDMHPKPIPGDWNGSGCHTNFSFKEMRKSWSRKKMKKLMRKFELAHDRHIKCYGLDNEKRLTGLHETQHIDKFSYGVGDRGASIRIPISVEQNDWCGYIEDRRPASNIDPYVVASAIMETIENENTDVHESMEEYFGTD